MLDKDSDTPLWRQIHDSLLREITSGAFYAGTALPSEKDLAERYGVNRHTVRRALKELNESGWLRTERGKGTLVLEQSLEYQLSERTRFTANMAQNKRRARSHFLFGDVLFAGEGLARQLRIPQHTPVVYIESFGEAGGKRIFVSSQYVPEERMPQLIDVFRHTGSLTKAFRAFGVKDYFRASSRISTRLANAFESEQLGISVRDPVLVMEYVNVDEQGVPIECGITRFCGDKLQVVVPGSPSWDGLQT